MSKTRFDRKPRSEQWDSLYAALAGGLDQTSSALAIKPGRVVQSLNFEEVFGQQGYQTIRGYERYDGRARPSQATYAVLNFKAGSAAFAQGDAVTNLAGTASGTVVSQTVSSGTTGAGTAAGYLILCKTVGTFADNDQIRVGGVQRALANGASTAGGVGFAAHVASLKATREYLRSLIGKVPGEGAILGGAVFNGQVYAVRNIVGSASASIYKESAGGWTAVATGLIPGGKWRFRVANFTGSPANLFLFGVDGRNRMVQISKAGAVTKAQPIYGSEALSTSSLTIALGTKQWVVANPSGRNYAVGDLITGWDSSNAANFMAGNVIGWNSGTAQLTVNITTAGGTGATIAAWEIGRTDFADKAFLLRDHKNHMFWAYPSGQLQTSNLGDPLNATSTAALFGTGQDITDLTSLRGKVLGVMMRSKVKLLSGSSATDWSLDDLSGDAGAIAGSTQDNGGNAIFQDTKGLTTLQTTQAFGDFAPSVLSANASSIVGAKSGQIVGSRMAKGNFQYRLYYADGSQLRGTIKSGAETITDRDVSFLASQYIHTPSCLFSGVMADGADRMFFGTTDGWLMEEDVGTSFDGTAIYFTLRLPFNHLKSSALMKQLMKLELELNSPDAVTLYAKTLFDYDDGTYLAGGEQASVAGTGGQWDASQFDQVVFDLPAVSRAEIPTSGICRNVALLLFFTSDYVRPVNLQGLLWYYVLLGMQR